MKYMLLIYGDEKAWTQSQLEDCYEASLQLVQQLRPSGQYLSSAPLHSVTTATSVQVRDGKKFVTDGSFAETREQLGGYYLIDAEHLNEAIAIAERIPAARKGTVEIRPIVELSGLSSEQ
jgi:hypothetical protein